MNQKPLSAKVAKPREAVPLFATTTPAANTPALILLPDERGVRGWVAGSTNYAGAKVTVSAGRTFETTVGDDNTFAVTASYPKPTPVTATVAAPPGGKSLTARTTLPAKPEGVRTTAFIVTDRSAYRPGHTLKFVAYLHETSDGIDFKPLANRDFTVDLTSETRKTRATRLKLRTDADGRLTGQYTFTDADALDHYQIAVTGAEAAGSARVLLGEYRKTKVGLKLKGEVKDGKLVVTFDARDYLDRPVKGTSATWNATVTKAADVAKLALEPTKFVMNEGGPPSIDDFDALPDDERLLTLASGVSAMSFAGLGGRTLATREGKAEFAGDKPATVSIDLWPEWLKGQHSVTVSGVFIDETGRENFAVGTFPLAPPDARGVVVSTSKELYATGEKVPVSVMTFGVGEKDNAASTVIAVKLDATPASPWVTPAMADPDGEFAPDNTRIPPLSETKPPAKKADTAGWKTVPVFDPVKRKVLTAVPVVNGKAEVDLRQPGAYKLLAVTRLADGTVLQSETGVVVKPAAKLPGVVLQLDARELPAGGRLSGTAHTRFAGAKMLLTLRDSGGVKLAKTLTAGVNGMVRFDEALPPNLRYGCAVCVQYPESASTVHADQRDLFVIPTDRTLTVTTTAPDTVGPGAEVKLGISVNREEEVDLVVSVFDESLLGVSGDLSGSIRDYYLADARGQGRAARDLTATCLGTISIADLAAKAERMQKDKDALAKEPGLDQRLAQLRTNWNAGQLTANDVVTLVRLAGFEVYLAQPVYADATRWSVPKTARLADLMRRDAVAANAKAYISATVVGNVVLLGLANRDTGHDPWALHRGNFTQMPPVWQPPCYGGFQCHGWSFCGGFSCTGFSSTFSGPGFSGPGFSAWGYPGSGFSVMGYGIGGYVGYPGFGGSYGISGISGFGGIGGIGGIGSSPGIGGGIGGAYGNLGAQFGFGKGSGMPSVAGFQGSFSYPVVGGQHGMSFGFNRDFGPPSGPMPIGAPMPGLGLADEVMRRDFADSAFWTATLRTDKTGKATASFKVPDSLTNWRVQVTAVSPKLHVGTAAARFKTSRPVMIWPMLPRAFAEGDTVRVFGTVHNLSDQEQNVRVHLKAENGEVLSDAEKTVKVPAGGNVPVYWTYKAGKPGMTDLVMSAKCDAGSDASHKKLPVVSSTVPERVTASGIVGKSDLKLVMPEGFDPKTAQVSVTVAPTLAADLADTLPYLVDYPHGCVEQTMSRFLPALRVAHIVRQSGLTTVKQLEEKLPKVVAAGQKRLIELQHPDGGWGWQGSSGTHEMMTPYALFGLIAAEEAGYPCLNEHTIPRGLAKLAQYLTNMGATWDATLQAQAATKDHRQINDALYCLWVYTMKEKPDMAVWWTRIERTMGRELMSDYGHALALEIAVKFGKKELADKLADVLRKRANKSGDRVYWMKAGFSNWGDNTTEVTAAVMKALVAHDSSDPLIPGILAYFHSTKRGDRWDSTKDTAAVLYALCDYLAAVRAGPAAAGIVKIALNGVESGNVRLDSAASKTAKFAGKDLKPGENSFTVKGADATGGALVRVTVTFVRTHGARTPARDHGAKVTRTVSVRGADGTWSELKSGATVPVGSYVKVRVTASATDAQPLRYFLIESPKPAGCETIAADDKRFPAPQEQYRHVLREDREAMTCFHYEHAPGPVGTEFVVLAEFAGEFTLPPARGEFMYQPTSGGHSDSFALKVSEKK